MTLNYRKIFIVGCPRSGTSWLQKMFGLHPDVIALPSESHVYPLIYDPFTYQTKLSLEKRLKNYKHLLRLYGLKPLLMGIQSRDLWRGLLRSHYLVLIGIIS